jgi:sucrose-phosphate synthase
MYIQLYQLHGLIRSKGLELGRDEDTGGQIIYIIELARALAKCTAVSRVEIVTRLFKDEDYAGYSAPIEPINAKVNIVRVPCGPSRYMKKVELWKHLDEFYENIHYYIKTDEQQPDVLHSNYYDSGYVCNKLSKECNIPHIFSAHSLGKPKLAEIKASFAYRDDIYNFYNFNARIETEQEIIKQADALTIFCEQESKDQFAQYEVDPEDPRFKIINPGVNSEKFRPYWVKKPSPDQNDDINHKLKKKIEDGLKEPDKPCIFMLSRLEAKKNISNMVECYVDDKELQDAANLIICAGKIKDRAKLTPPQLEVLHHIEKLIDFSNTHDKVLLLDELDYETEVPEFYRIVGRKCGIFVDCDITDPLPLTVIEAALSGIPVVAHHTCALLSVISKGKSELLINVKKHHLLSRAILKLLKDRELWLHCSKAGVECILNELTWEIMADKVLKVYQEVVNNYKK